MKIPEEKFAQRFLGNEILQCWPKKHFQWNMAIYFEGHQFSTSKEHMALQCEITSSKHLLDS